VGLGLGLGLRCGSGCNASCSFGLGFGCCCWWRFSGPPSGIAPAYCEATRPPQSCLAVYSVPAFLASWAGAAWHTGALASTSVVMSVIPVPHCTLFLWWSSHVVYRSSSHSFMPSHCDSSHATCASSILAMQLIVWCS
jgi:hypothetical protein